MRDDTEDLFFADHLLMHTRLAREGSHPLFTSIEHMADTLLVSLPTLSRWAAGKNLPHRALRATILAQLAGSTEEKRQQ